MGTGSDSYWLPPILKRLGELYAQRGDRVRAVASYSRFVELWKNADQEFQPILATARDRIAELKRVKAPR